LIGCGVADFAAGDEGAGAFTAGVEGAGDTLVVSGLGAVVFVLAAGSTFAGAAFSRSGDFG